MLPSPTCKRSTACAERQAAKNLLLVLVVSVSCLHILLLLFDEIALHLGLLGLLMQYLYFQFLQEFPKVNLKSPLTVATLGDLNML
jgi:4-hydroxybenzoate polyprenyltransferase